MATSRDASLRGSGGVGGTVCLREGSIKGSPNWSAWTEEGSFPNWASMRFEVFLWFPNDSSSNLIENFGGEFLLPPMFLVRVRTLWLNLEILKMKDWVQLLRNPLGSTHTPLGEDHTQLTRRCTQQYNLGFY
ncbi:hypothetical protein PVAP13_9NG418014 [Panicum virgatum]|uniref:Uncharacterized protein n=1 Tax=Panicum virgatum TaxID=38727 RepID=A0A8T0MPR6_PANVG|nr:hypothetical protein PVAP13_9NG418014 [Panicum virgatum]